MGDKETIEVLEMIMRNMREDARAFDCQPFNGRTVARYFGNQGAAIAELADTIKSLVEKEGA